MSQLIFDKYEIIRRLAVGGMGEIFLARQRGVAGFDRLVILKSLLPDLAEQEGFVDQFLDEARVAATLNHPNIVSIYEVGAWQGVYFIAMEYINGDSLSGLVPAAAKAGLSIPFPVTARIIHDAALGLDHAHHASDPDGRPLNIVHRDVTPQNIMVRTDGVTKVVDFGVARAANRVTRTATGMVKGKLPYMPPEQISGQQLDHRTDQWALGVVLWEMLTGQRLFRAENDALLINLILKHPIPPPSDLVEGVPRELEEVLVRMLDRDRAGRFRRLQEVADALRGYLDSVSSDSKQARVAEFVQGIAGDRIKERVTDLTPSRPENFLIPLQQAGAIGADTRGGATRPERRKPAAKANPWALMAGGAAAVIVIAGGVGFMLSQKQPAPPPPAPVVVAPPVPTPVEQPAPKPEPKPVEPAPEPPTVLQLDSDPSEAKVYSGERLVGQTPLRLSTLSPDTDYQLVVDKTGFEPSIVKVRLEKGATQELSVPLQKKKTRRPGPGPSQAAPVAAAAEDGFLTLKTTPWTKVSIAGTPYGSTPLFKVKLRPGTYSVVLVNEQEGINETRSVTIPAGEVAKLDLVLKK